MSQVLYKGGNIVVTGHSGPEYSCVPGSTDPSDIRRVIQLQFIVQVNGRMIVHNFTLDLKKTPENTASAWEVLDYSVCDWAEWYTLCSVFSSFGYSFTDERIDMAMHSNHILKDWLQIIFGVYAPVQSI